MRPERIEYFAGTGRNEPQPVAELEEPHAVFGRHDPAVLVEVREIRHARTEALLLAPADMSGRRVALELAEVAGEGELLLVGDVLLAEHKNGVLVHAGLDRRHFHGAERATAVDPGDLPDKHRMQRTDRNGHGGLPFERLVENLTKIL